MRRTAAALAALALVTAATVSHAEAGPPGQWTRLPGTVINFAETGLARTSDGVLHVVWVRKNGTKSDLVHTPILPGGAVGPTTVALGGWRTMNHPDLVRMPDGTLRAFFGGIRSTASGETNTALNTATAPAAGTPWTLQIGKAAQATSAYAGATTGAGLARDGTPISTWYSAGGLGFHYGTNPADPDRLVPSTDCCLYEPEIAVDALNGQAYIGFFSLEKAGHGVFVQRIAPSGVVGARMLAPGSQVGGDAVNPGGRTALTARIGSPGVFVVYGQGYPTFATVAAWRVGTGKPQLVVKADRARHVGGAAAPEGRVWLMWEQAGAIHATRTNRAVTRIGPVTTLQPPRGAAVYRIDGEGSAGPLDLTANLSAGGQAFFHQQVWPRLELRGTAVTKNDQRVVTFKVTDAGDPVTGATVKAGGKSATTNAAGVATLALAAKTAAVASKPGYAAAKTTA